MRMTLSMGPGYRQVITDLKQAGPNVIEAVKTGLEKAVKHAAAHVTTSYLSGQYLNRRTGSLAKSVDGWSVGDAEAIVGIRKDAAVSRYAYLLGDQNVTIRPKKGKYLAIPIGENLTSSGVAKKDSPRDFEDGFFIRSGPRLLFGRKNGKRGKFRPLFTLVKQVQVQGTSALADGVKSDVNNMTDILSTELDKKVNR